MGSFMFTATVSLDGFIEDRNGKIEWTNPDEEVHRYFNRMTDETGLVIMGRRQYETMEPFWTDLDRNPEGPDYVVEFARIWANKPKMVVSRSLDTVPDPIRLVRRIDPAWATELRQKVDGPISVSGADLASGMAAQGMIDEVEMMLKPVVLCGGKPFFGPGFHGHTFETSEVRQFSDGSTAIRYRVIRSNG